MRAVLIVVTAVIGTVIPAQAQQGTNYPAPGSNRGPAFPTYVSPTEKNSTNWKTSPKEYTPQGVEGRLYRWYSLRARGGWDKWHQ
jgi:hypothetical protein